MSATNSQPLEFTITLTEDERAELSNFLEQTLQRKQIEEHRTEAHKFREHVQHQEAILESLIQKLRRY